MADSIDAPARHKWLDVFVQAPEQAFGDLLAGHARIFPYDRADAPDAAVMLFAPLPANDPARLALGPAVLGWLDARRRQAPPREQPRLQRWIREIVEAFEIVAALDVAGAALALRQRFVTWNEWASRFVLTPARDARAAYWRMLAQTQPLLSREALADLSPLWLAICRRSGDDLPQHYLSIGLLGLRRAAAGQAGADVNWVTGLAHWALANDPSPDQFKAAWLAMKPLYPRTPGQWRQVVGRLLATPTFRDAGITAPAWWSVDPDFAPMARADFKLAGDRLRSPMPDETKAIAERINERWDRTEPLIDRLVHGHRTYANATGDSHFIVRAAHAVGAALIKGGGDHSLARARKAKALAREGLSWAPFDRHLWSLWRDALEAEGAMEAAEMVGWESIRKDPDDADARTQLASLLAGPLGRADDAAALLRETIVVFPGNAVVRTQLATLLAGPLGRADDAAALLRETIAVFPGNAVARNQLAEVLIAQGDIVGAEASVAAAFVADAADEATYALRARLLSHRGDIQGALAAVRAGLQIAPTNAILRHFEHLLTSGRPLRLGPSAKQTAAATVRRANPAREDPALAEAIRYGRMRQLRARSESGDAAERAAALAAVYRTLQDDPTFAYAALLAARYGLTTLDVDTMPNFAVAFEHALGARDRDRLTQLARTQPRLRALTLVGQALLGDADAAWTVATLLNEDPPKHEARAVTFLRDRLLPLLGYTDRMTVAGVIAANQDTIRRWLRDANEATLGEPIAA